MKFVLLSLVTLLCSLAIQSLSTQDASDSGRNFRLRQNHILDGQLRDRSGRYRSSSIDLSGFIANINGNLKFQRNGLFNRTCRNCSINQRLVLSCTCQTANRRWISTTLRTGAFIENENGRFVIRR